MYGTCKYCGQRITLPDLTDATQEEANKEASRRCGCAQSVADQRIEETVENAKDCIRQCCGAECAKYGLQPATEYTIELLNHLVEDIAYMRINQATIQTSDGSRVRISVNAKGKIKVDRTESRSLNLEA